MSKSELSITLTKAQADKLLRDASAQQKLATLVASLGPSPDVKAAARRLVDDERYSSSLARAMLVYAGFPADGQARSVTELSKQLDMAPSMVHRYISTFVELGLLERDPVLRTYRLPVPADESGTI